MFEDHSHGDKMYNADVNIVEKMIDAKSFLKYIMKRLHILYEIRKMESKRERQSQYDFVINKDVCVHFHFQINKISHILLIILVNTHYHCKHTSTNKKILKYL